MIKLYIHWQHIVYCDNYHTVVWIIKNELRNQLHHPKSHLKRQANPCCETRDLQKTNNSHQHVTMLHTVRNKQLTEISHSIKHYKPGAAPKHERLGSCFDCKECDAPIMTGDDALSDQKDPSLETSKSTSGELKLSVLEFKEYIVLSLLPARLPRDAPASAIGILPRLAFLSHEDKTSSMNCIMTTWMPIT